MRKNGEELMVVQLNRLDQGTENLVNEERPFIPESKKKIVEDQTNDESIVPNGRSLEEQFTSP